MLNKPDNQNAPLIVNEGTIFNRKDMIKVLDTLDTVEYTHFVDSKEVAHGQGQVLSIFASHESASLIVNNCLYLNIMSFNYLKFYLDGNKKTVVELISNDHLLRLKAIENLIGQEKNLRNLRRPLVECDDETYSLLEELEEEEE